jgi:hypothetical protein
MMIEIAGNDMYFQTMSRTGVEVDSGVIHRTIRPAPAGVPRPQTAQPGGVSF